LCSNVLLLFEHDPTWPVSLFAVSCRDRRHSTKLGLASIGTPTALHRVHRWRSDEGFDSSEAIKSKIGIWTFEDRDQFPTNPRAYAQGATMTYAGESDPAKRADIIDDLHKLPDNPEPLPAK
jgi:cytochrome c2